MLSSQMIITVMFIMHVKDDELIATGLVIPNIVKKSQMLLDVNLMPIFLSNLINYLEYCHFPEESIFVYFLDLQINWDKKKHLLHKSTFHYIYVRNHRYMQTLMVKKRLP